MHWITLALACAITLGASIGVTFILFPQKLQVAYRIALVLVTTAPFLGEATIATSNLTPVQIYSLKNARITAQIYREAYQAISPAGSEKEYPEGWYLRTGEEIPGRIETSVLPFEVEGSDAQFLNYTGTPAATMRASIKDLPATPIQVCTGACEGLAEIADLKGADGIVVADWRRVQDVAIGQPAPALATDILMQSGLAIGRWCLTIGLALLTTGIAVAVLQYLEGGMKGRRAKTTAAPSSKAKVQAKNR